MNQADDGSVTSNLKAEFEESAGQLSERLVGIALSWTLDAELASEVVQEAFQRFLSRMEALNWSQDIKSLEAYLTTTAHNCYRDLVRKRAKARFESLDSDPQGKLHTEAYQALSANQVFTGIDPEALNELQKAVPEKTILRGFTEDDLELLRLHEVDDLPPKEIANRRGEDADKVRYRLTKIKAKISYRAQQYLKVSGKKSLF